MPTKSAMRRKPHGRIAWRIPPAMLATAALSGLLASCASHDGMRDALDTLSNPQRTSDWKGTTYRGDAAGSRVQTGALQERRGEQITETVIRGSGQFLGPAIPYSTGRTFAGGEGVTLNLVGVPVQAAAKTVLGDILQLNYTVSDKAAGSITLQTTTPVDRDALYDAFEAALKPQGIVIVKAGEFYRVVAAAEAGRLGSPLSTPRRPIPGGQVQILPLRYVAAAEAQRLIEPIVHQNAILRVDETRNLLVVQGTAKELAQVHSLLGVFDVDWMRGMSFALVPVKTSDPDAIAQELETVFGTDKNGPSKGLVKFVPNKRLGSILVITSRPQQLDAARRWISRLDKLAEGGEEQMFVYKIQNRPAAELAAVLQKVLTSGAGQQQDAAVSAVAPRFEPAEVTSTAPDPILTPSPLPLQTTATLGNAPRPLLAEPTGPAPALTPRPSGAAFQVPGAKVVADEANNAVLIQAVPKEYERILRILERLDVLPTQVMLEAVIAEVTLNDELRFGTKWFFQRNRNSVTFTDSALGIVAPTFPGFSYFFNSTDIRVTLDALQAVTNVNVVSAPSLMVMDNRRATLQIGDQVPIITQTARSVINPDAPIVNAVQLRDTGVILSVTPRVNDSGRVVLDVEQEVSNVSRTTSSGIDSPTIQQRRVRTTVVVSDGEVIALGGLIQNRDTTETSQVPFLGNLPVVGSAFRQKANEVKRTELLIFIRPLVVRDSREAGEVTDEFRRRLRKPTPLTRREIHRRDFDRVVR